MSSRYRGSVREVKAVNIPLMPLNTSLLAGLSFTMQIPWLKKKNHNVAESNLEDIDASLNAYKKKFVSDWIPEWQQHYFNFSEAMYLLKQVTQSTMRNTFSLASQRISEINLEDNPFEGTQKLFDFLNDEYTKINAFYLEKEEEYAKRYDDLLFECKKLKEITDRKEFRYDSRVVKAAFGELYRAIEMLHKFSTVNHAAVIRILKASEEYIALISVPGKTKADELLIDATTLAHHHAALNNQSFLVNLTKINQLMGNLENAYSEYFNVSIEKAKTILNRPNKQLSLSTMFTLGLWTGINVTLMFLLSSLFIWTKYEFNVDAFLSVFPIFRGFSYLIYMIWCWGIALFIFKYFRINYIFILNLDRSTALGYFQVFKMAGLLTSLWLACFLLFTIHTKTSFLFFNFSHHWYPLVLLMISVVLMFNPFHFFYRGTRIWIGRILLESFMAPFTECVFVHFFVTDVLTSMPKFFTDIEYSLCFYISGDWESYQSDRCTDWAFKLLPYTAAVPLMVRFWQCMRRLYFHPELEHAANALKYILSMFANVYGAAWDFQRYRPDWSANRIFWFTTFIISTVYLLWWDIYMDWGLGSRQHRFLRGNLLFKPYIYYLAICFDVFGRFAWMWALMEYPIPGVDGIYLTLIFGFLEITRRSMWSVFRIENEHLENISNSRAFKEISLPSDLRSASEKDTLLTKAKSRLMGGLRQVDRINTASDDEHKLI